MTKDSGLYFRFDKLCEVFSEIGLKSEGEKPLQELEETQPRPEPQVGAQEVEEIIEVESVQAGLLRGHSLGEAEQES